MVKFDWEMTIFDWTTRLDQRLLSLTRHQDQEIGREKKIII